MNLRSRVRFARVLTLALLIPTLAWMGCSGEESGITTPTAETTAIADSYFLARGVPADRLAEVFAIQERNTPSLMAIQDVVGTATSIDENGQPFVVVYTERALGPGKLPPFVDGVRVREVVSGRVVAFKGPPGGGGGGGGSLDPKALQTPPIQMGTSGGWGYDLANGYCCGGTLGSLVQIGSTKYMLSNYHVLEADKVDGGNGRTVSNGDPVIQPGLIDVGCNANNAQVVGSMSVKNALPNSNVDAAVAAVVSGMVDESGAILGIGTISSQTAGAFVGQAVKKMGRTTGLSRSAVDGLNATINVSYENECAGSAAFTKTFTGQIIISNRGSKFLAGGDSGSLMVEDVTTNPRAVGLLFAGSNSLAVANPIDEVLGFLNASMVGN